MQTRHVAVDIGAASGRMFMGEVRDGVLSASEIHRFVTRDVFLVDRRVRNFYRYYEDILHGLQVYARQYGPVLDSIGVDGFGSDFTLLDRSGQPAMLTPSYRQGNLESMRGRIEELFGGYALYRRNGNHSMVSDTLQQLLRMRKLGEPAIDNPGAILFFADIFHYLLGAPACVEHSLASYSRFYNNLEQEWDDEVLAAFQLPAGLKTPVVHCGEQIGTVHRQISHDTGLRPGTRIITPCSHDTACAALAVPDNGDDWIFISSGSWSLLGTETDSPVLSEKAYRANMSNSSMPFGANMLKKNIAGMWLMQECQRIWQKYRFEQLVEFAEAADADDLYIDVDEHRFYAPENMAEEVSDDVFSRYGVRIEPDDVGRITRVCLQSIAMKYRYFVDLVIDLTGKKIGKIHILGGGGRNRLLNALTANITGLPVFTGVYEASVTGNLLLQAYGYGQLATRSAIRDVVKNSCPLIKTEPRECAAWEKRYRKYIAAMDKNSFY